MLQSYLSSLHSFSYFKDSSFKLKLNYNPIRPQLEPFSRVLSISFDFSIVNFEQALNWTMEWASLDNFQKMYFHIVATLDDTNYLWNSPWRGGEEVGGTKRCREQIPLSTVNWQLTAGWVSRQSNQVRGTKTSSQILRRRLTCKMTDGTDESRQTDRETVSVALRAQWKFKSIGKRLWWVRYSPFLES